jgi:hypothetical protein
MGPIWKFVVEGAGQKIKQDFWVPANIAVRMAHCAVAINGKTRLNSISMIEWRAAITLLLEASVRILHQFRTLPNPQARYHKANSIMTDITPISR